MEEVIEGGPWLFQGQPIVLQKWQHGMALRKHYHTQVPIWIKLRHLPVEFWTEEGLSMVASGVGRPLYPDANTKACMILDFARVCVMLDYNSKLPKYIIVMQPTKDDGETPCKVDIEYEWIPSRCTTCCSLGHWVKQCPTTKFPIRPPVTVYVPKPKPPMDVPKQKQVHMPPMPRPVDERVGDVAVAGHDVHSDKGKAIMVHM
ncbi:hypothetical protein Sango_2487000 [Sesamum angolense]|uniref:DUF4283 domain-containing protein n=1 Tax=Sesamum angolense TaxID=2727404 RepID=A0AAE2BI14_9LAMI|nr:hypothetical protein Sango_2487000 [Sesamum angolense]